MNVKPGVPNEMDSGGKILYSCWIFRLMHPTVRCWKKKKKKSSALFSILSISPTLKSDLTFSLVKYIFIYLSYHIFLAVQTPEL